MQGFRAHGQNVFGEENDAISLKKKTEKKIYAGNFVNLLLKYKLVFKFFEKCNRAVKFVRSVQSGRVRLG